MALEIVLKLENNTYLKDPQGSEIGKKIIKSSILLISELGYEHFTFKKLAIEINSTEATIYRYFENKHKILVYIMELYWSYIHFQVLMAIREINDSRKKIEKIIDLLVWEDNQDVSFGGYDQACLYKICITEGSKAFLSKEVEALNQQKLFEPYKELVEMIAGVFSEYKPTFKYPRSLASSLVELSHLQYYFMHHLPRLTDLKEKTPKSLEAYLEHLVFGSLELNRK